MTPFFKPILAFFAALLVGSLVMVAAHAADQVTLGPDGCGLVKQCYTIPNDAGLYINLYGAPGYPYFFLAINGDLFKASVPSGTEGTNVVLADSSGNVIYLTYSFSTYRTCNHSGRGQTCSTHWQFVGGSITQ